MALTVYKISEYTNWKANSPSSYAGGGVGAPVEVDLSNYYTKTELNTAGLSIVDWGNIVNYPYVYTFPYSIDNIANVIQLENDELAPGNNQYYGTNASGVKGWWPLIGGTGGALLPRNQILYWNVAQNWYQPYPNKPLPGGGGGGGGGGDNGAALYNWFAAKGIPEQPPEVNAAFELTFDNIANNPYDTVEEWNTFFDLPNYGVPFTSMEIVSNTVRLLGSYEITIIVKEELFYQEPFSSHLVGIDDKKGCIVEATYYSFYGLEYVTVLKFPMLSTVRESAFGGCGTSAAVPGIVNDFHNVITVGMQAFTASAFISFNFPVLNVAADYAFSSQGYLTSVSMPQLLLAGIGCFYGTIIEDYSFPNLLEARSSCFAACNNLKTVNLPKATTIGDNLFNGINTLTYVNMPVVTDFGSTTGNDFVFYQTGTTITLVIPAATAYDDDVTWLQANNTVTLILT